MIYYVIPARQGSKGMPLKNRRLFHFTSSTIPSDEWENTILTTDDRFIMRVGSQFNIIERSDKLSGDTASTKDVLLDVIRKEGMKRDDIIVMLYLTYPERTWGDIQKGIDLFIAKEAKSMLCKKDIKTNPYLCIHADGSQVVKHNLYRRQDYPEVFEISHFLFIANVGEIKNLNNNLYNKNTVYMHIPDKVDVDTEQDYMEFA